MSSEVKKTPKKTRKPFAQQQHVSFLHNQGGGMGVRRYDETDKLFEERRLHDQNSTVVNKTRLPFARQQQYGPSLYDKGILWPAEGEMNVDQYDDIEKLFKKKMKAQEAFYFAQNGDEEKGQAWFFSSEGEVRPSQPNAKKSMKRPASADPKTAARKKRGSVSAVRV
eukprot:1456924-Rhodomonas_salina.1